jgi:clan AA aspartic protease
MILGEFIDGRVVLPVSFYLGESTDLIVNFVVDTGFNDYLTLPPQAVAAMGLPFYTTMVARLADGRKSSIPVHSARIKWDDREQLVPVLATGIKPLLGTALLQGFRLIVEFANNGMVKVEKI